MKENQQSLQSLQEDIKSVKVNQQSLQEDIKSVKGSIKSLQENHEKVLGTLDGKLEELQQSLALQKKLMKPLYTIKPVPEDVVSVLTSDTFRNNVPQLYARRSCVVLSQLFPCRDQDFWFPAATEHIVPRQQWQTACLYGFEATDAQNGLPLLKDLELKCQAGHFTFIPTGLFMADSVELEIHVAESHKNVRIKYRDHNGRDDGQVRGWKRDGRGKYIFCDLVFGDLHQQIINVRPKPYMRALYLKADMAHDQHPDLPHPSDYLDHYTKDCEAMKGVLFQKLLGGNGGQQQSAIEAS